MVATLELFDGTTTLDLYDGSDYKAITPLRFGVPPADVILAALSLRGYRYRPRTVTVGLRVIGTSVADLSANVRTLEGMLIVAKERQRLDQGTIVVLKTQLGNTDADDVQYRVLSGDLNLGPFLDEPGLKAFTAKDGTLTLLLEPLGRLAAISTSAATLENEQDGTDLNHMDITDLAVGEAGETQEAGRLQLKVHDPATNAWNGSKKMWVAKRSGSRRTDTLFFQGEAESGITAGSDPSTDDSLTFSSNGAFSIANSSGGQASYMQWKNGTGVNKTAESSTFLTVGRIEIQIAGGSLPKGIFRVLARVQLDRNSSGVLWDAVAGAHGFALGYTFGAKTVTPVEADNQVIIAEDAWEMKDLGEIVIPATAVPDGITAPTLELRIHATYNTTTSFNINGSAGGAEVRYFVDYIFLLPVDEGMWTVDSIATADRVLADSESDKPGIYVLNSSDVVQKFATKTGSPFDIGPEDTRIYWLRDDTGDPTLIQAVVTPVYTPQVRGF